MVWWREFQLPGGRFGYNRVPVVRAVDGKRAIVTRLRYVMEGPAAQIATAGPQFVLDQSVANGNRPGDSAGPAHSTGMKGISK